MPQLTKGGKWVFGWCVVGEEGAIQIPPEACAEYGFLQGDVVIFLTGSRRSGGVIVGHIEKFAEDAAMLLRRSIGRGVIGENKRINIPPRLGIQPGERLLAVRGSGLALSFVRHGPIIEEAVLHTNIVEFATS